MRLSPEEIAAILQCAVRHFGPDTKVRLFGSRIDDWRRGGDIDLLIETAAGLPSPLDAERRFRIELKECLGDKKIDVVLRSPGERLGFIDDIARRYGLVLELDSSLTYSTR
jgi:predicted nucleotidyltransferase